MIGLHINIWNIHTCFSNFETKHTHLLKVYKNILYGKYLVEFCEGPSNMYLQSHNIMIPITTKLWCLCANVLLKKIVQNQNWLFYFIPKVLWQSMVMKAKIEAENEFHLEIELKIVIQYLYRTYIIYEKHPNNIYVNNNIQKLKLMSFTKWMSHFDEFINSNK